MIIPKDALLSLYFEYQSTEVSGLLWQSFTLIEFIVDYAVYVKFVFL